MTAGVPERWRPDLHMVDAVLSMPKASRRLTELDMPDRCWLVAGLTVRGLTAKQIAERCGCSERLAKAVRAEAAYQVAIVAHEELQAITHQLHAESSEHSHTRRELQVCRSEHDRVRMQFDQLISSHLTGRVPVFPKCQHPQLKHNVRERGGKRFCRECDRLRQQARRQRLKAS
jgi:DNA-binding CsgD family transcriptional regulator